MIFTLLIIIVLVAFSALFSGLTLGLMSLDPFELRRMVRLGNKQAKKIYPLRKRGNQLLVTLLLGNVAVNSILSIFLGSITTGVVAVIISTALIVLLGEIVPQAVFARFALRLGARVSSITKIIMLLLYPIAKPIAVMLDAILGNEIPKAYSKEELGVLLEDQANLKRSKLDADELQILRGGLRFSEKRVGDVMTPEKNTYFLDADTILTADVLSEIHKQGHSRIPVYKERRDNIIGLLYVKDLAVVNPEDEVHVEAQMRDGVKAVKASDRLDDVLNGFKKERVHLFIVEDDGEVSGIITLEDIVEEFIGEVVDEYDRLVDMRRQDSHIE